MSSRPNPTRPEDESHAQRLDEVLREHAEVEPDLERQDENLPQADHDPASPVSRGAGRAPKINAPDEQLAPASEFEAGVDAAEDEAQSAGEAASRDDLNR